jgi:hypothetical protein
MTSIILPQKKGIEFQLKKYSFGKAWNIENNNDVIGDEGAKYDTVGIVYTNGTYYARNKKFGRLEAFELLRSKFLKLISLDSAELVNGIENIFRDKERDTIKAYIWLRDIKIRSYIQAIWLNNLLFQSGILIGRGEVLGQIDIYNNTFKNVVRLMQIDFKKFVRDSSYRVYDTEINFWGNDFLWDTKIEMCKFYSNVVFKKGSFNSVSFKGTTFFEKVIFGDLLFNNYTSFNRASFVEIPDFNRVVFKDTLDLRSTNFNKGVDYRRADFDSLNVIFFRKS